MSILLMKKSFQIISGTRLAALIDEKVGNLDDFAGHVGFTRQWVNKLIKKEKIRIGPEKVEKMKNYLNVTFEDLKYIPRETIGNQIVITSEIIEKHPLYIALKRELEEVRTSREDWKERAREYKAEIDKLRSKEN